MYNKTNAIKKYKIKETVNKQKPYFLQKGKIIRSFWIEIRKHLEY